MRRAQLIPFVAMILCIRFVSCSSCPTDKCFIELSRDVGVGPRNRYTLLCKSAPRIARVFFSVPVPPGDNVGRSSATVNCIAREERRLTSMCNRLNETEFERRAFPVLERCVNRPILTPDEEKATQPFTFNKATCISKFGSAPGRQATIVAWICECVQFDFYEVKPGFPVFAIKGNPIEAAEEFEFVRRCAEEATEQMQEVCRSSPSDYEILGLHILQTCCKRARVKSETKFECAAIVPDDLSQFKVNM